MAPVTYSKANGTLAVHTGHPVEYVLKLFEQAEAAGSLVETDLTLPQDARVERVTFTVSAQPGGFTTLGSVADVRPANPVAAGSEAACTIDFGALVTAGGLAYEGLGPAINRVYQWTGSSWLPLPGATGGAFAEVSSARLLIETDDEVSGAELATSLLDSGGVQLPAVPTSLELMVDGVTVWFERQGSTPPDEVSPPAGGVAYRVDRTDLVRQAFDRARPAGGTKTVRVALRAATPGTLVLRPEIASLRVHTVQFPPTGLSSTVDALEEGPVSFDISPPAQATEVAEVSLLVRGSFGPDRVQPASGPPLEPDAALAVIAGRPVMLGIPATLAGRFDRLTGVRLWLRTPAGGSGTEVSGRLLADADGRPGEPLDAAELTALTVRDGVQAWHTLTFAEPVTLPPVAVPADSPPDSPAEPRVPAWLELRVAYGEVECGLTVAAPDDPVAPGAQLRRWLPGGAADELTTVPALGVLRGVLRLVGIPDRDRPIPAATLTVPRGDTEAGVTPTGDDLAAVLALAQPVTPAGTPSVVLDALLACAGSLTVDTVQVAYREGAPS